MSNRRGNRPSSPSSYTSGSTPEDSDPVFFLSGNHLSRLDQANNNADILQFHVHICDTLYSYYLQLFRSEFVNFSGAEFKKYIQEGAAFAFDDPVMQSGNQGWTLYFKDGHAPEQIKEIVRRQGSSIPEISVHIQALTPKPPSLATQPHLSSTSNSTLLAPDSDTNMNAIAQLTEHFKQLEKQVAEDKKIDREQISLLQKDRQIDRERISLLEGARLGDKETISLLKKRLENETKERSRPDPEKIRLRVQVEAHEARIEDMELVINSLLQEKTELEKLKRLAEEEKDGAIKALKGALNEWSDLYPKARSYIFLRELVNYACFQLRDFASSIYPASDVSSVFLGAHLFRTRLLDFPNDVERFNAVKMHFDGRGEHLTPQGRRIIGDDEVLNYIIRKDTAVRRMGNRYAHPSVEDRSKFDAAADELNGELGEEGGIVKQLISTIFAP